MASFVIELLAVAALCTSRPPRLTQGGDQHARKPADSGAVIAQQPSTAGRSAPGSAPASTAVEYQTRAMAWCYRKPKSGVFQCSGPLQMMIIIGEPDLAYALKLAGCEGGEGKLPALGASEKFDCGYMLRPHERRMPEQSPYPE